MKGQYVIIDLRNMDFMKNELMNQRPPANIMEALKNGDLKIEY